jgi:hypothetical protein
MDLFFKINCGFLVSDRIPESNVPEEENPDKYGYFRRDYSK